MWERAVELLGDLLFWLAVGGTVILWWPIGLAIARFLYGASGKPLAAARIAAIWAVFLAPIPGAVFGWFRWRDYIAVGAVAAVALLFTFAVWLLLGRGETEPASA